MDEEFSGVVEKSGTWLRRRKEAKEMLHGNMEVVMFERESSFGIKYLAS